MYLEAFVRKLFELLFASAQTSRTSYYQDKGQEDEVIKILKTYRIW